MMKNILLLSLLSLMFFVTLEAQTQARFYTSFGDFDVELREDLVPITANNFIALADTKYYDNIIWHRVIKNFMIQSGDPTGTGSGGPGYTIPDEFHPTLRHYKKGIISMANAGPNTGGSQFFVTLRATLWLDSLHAVFGEVVNNQYVVDSIGETPTNSNDRPITPVFIDSIRVLPIVGRLEQLERKIAILGGNFPNPFSDQTTFTFGLYEAADVEISIIGMDGRIIRVLRKKALAYGDHHINWNGLNEQGVPVPNGMYIYRLSVPGYSDTKLMVLQH